jgi:hypothetical protein
VSRIRETRDAYKILIGKSLGKHPLEREGRILKASIKMGLRETTGNGSISLAMADCGIIGVETSVSASTVLVN